ncbi:MAG TPA: ATP-binding protein [Longimicrobium sp.]|jgi:signal transduction histidine kinase
MTPDDEPRTPSRREHTPPSAPARRPHVPGRNTWLPLSLVVFSLLGLVLVPALLQRRSELLRREIIDVVEPARRAEGEVDEALAVEVSAGRGYIINRDPAFLDRSARAAAKAEREMDRLEGYARRLGPEAVARVADLRRHVRAWREPGVALTRGEVPPDRFAALVGVQQHHYEAALRSAAQVQKELEWIAADRRDRIRGYERMELASSVFLTALALAAVGAVTALTVRERRLASQVAVRVEKEASLRALARTLSGALSVREMVEKVAEEAVHSTRAFGAYVERAQAHEVVVVAGSGEGVPPLGTRAPYPGSLTAEIIEAREPRALAEVAKIGESMAPYLEKSCERCTGLVVPLADEEGVLGALILLRSPGQGTFGGEEAAHARAMGDLLSVAFRRALVMEEERRARGEAETAVRTRDEMLSIVSHDLRNPLHTVGMSSSFLLDVLPDDDEMVRKQLAIIKRSIDSMNRMIEDLLDITRIETGRLAVDCSVVEVPTLLDEVETMMRPLAEGAGLRLKCHAGDRLPTLYADRDRLVQVFSNLVGNAIKFTPEGGTVTLRAEGMEGAVCFQVADTGAGIPAEHLPRLFDRFWQARRTDRRGLGLGLPIVKGIVEAHGGHVEVASTPGAGSTFSFTLPAAPAR